MKTKISKSSLKAATESLAATLESKGIALGESHVDELNDVLTSFLTENCAVKVVIAD